MASIMTILTTVEGRQRCRAIELRDHLPILLLVTCGCRPRHHVSALWWSHAAREGARVGVFGLRRRTFRIASMAISRPGLTRACPRQGHLQQGPHLGRRAVHLRRRSSCNTPISSCSSTRGRPVRRHCSGTSRWRHRPMRARRRGTVTTRTFMVAILERFHHGNRHCPGDGCQLRRIAPSGRSRSRSGSGASSAVVASHDLPLGAGDQGGVKLCWPSRISAGRLRNRREGAQPRRCRARDEERAAGGEQTRAHRSGRHCRRPFRPACARSR